MYTPTSTFNVKMPRLSSFFVLVLITASILCFLCQLYLLSDVDAAMRPDDDSSHEIVLEFLSPSAEQSLEIIESFSENNNSQVFAPLGNFNNATSVNVSVLMPGDLSNSTIYRCGYDVVTLIFAHVYPEIKDKILKATHLITLEMAQLASENDVLIVGGEGDCKNRKAPMPIDWLEDNFKGTIFIVNGESRVDRHKWRDLEDISTIPKNQYHLGHIADGCQSRRLHFLAQEFVRKRHLWDFFMKEEDKQKSTRERFLIYTNGHCVDFRDNAFDAIARATPTLKLEFGGKCNGNMKNLPNVVKSDLPFGKLNQYSQNWKMMRNYRFCLVMENSYVEGYITEKIMNAFAGGCIP